MRTPHRLTALVTISVTLTAPAAAALTEAQIAGNLEARFQKDRSGVCVVAAVVEGKQVARSRYCAKPRDEPGFDTAFEIGSVSKTMTAFLVADLIEQGKWSLDDPIAKHLPSSVKIPRQGERQILVRDLVTHSAGLPGLASRFRPADAKNPYANLSEEDLLA